MTMAASTFKKSGYCGYTAAAYTSAHNLVIQDTALGAVSVAIFLEIPVHST